MMHHIRCTRMVVHLNIHYIVTLLLHDCNLCVYVCAVVVQQRVEMSLNTDYMHALSAYPALIVYLFDFQASLFLLFVICLNVFVVRF
jgi:hypothetical protein